MLISEIRISGLMLRMIFIPSFASYAMPATEQSHFSHLTVFDRPSVIIGSSSMITTLYITSSLLSVIELQALFHCILCADCSFYNIRHTVKYRLSAFSLKFILHCRCKRVCTVDQCCCLQLQTVHFTRIDLRSLLQRSHAVLGKPRHHFIRSHITDEADGCSPYIGIIPCLFRNIIAH